MVITTTNNLQQKSHYLLPNLDQLSKDQLIYRGEGNSSLVVAIKSTCQVIRLLKSDAKKLRNAYDVLTHQLQNIHFNECILPDVIPDYLFSSPKMICLDREKIELIRNFVKDKRPSFRLNKTFSDCGYAFLMMDYCSLPSKSLSYDWTIDSVIAVEIKPKQGFLPNVDLFCSNDPLRLKSRICRFGLSQFYKFQKQSIKKISSYCPLDLFSGCPSRTLYALLCLMKNPQNNFRVFINSHLIYDDKSDLDSLSMILDDFFKKNQQQRTKIRDSSEITQIFDSIIASDNGNHSPSYVNDDDDDENNNNDAVFNDNFKAINNSIMLFGSLLLQILLKPLCDENETRFEQQQPKILKQNNKNNYKYAINLQRELKNLNKQDRYVFFRTFIQIFEKFPLNLMQQQDISNQNSNNNLVKLNKDVFNHNQKIFIDMNINRHTNYSKTKIIKMLMNVPIKDKCECLLHQDKNFNCFDSKMNFDCKCDEISNSSDQKNHCLPNQSILYSILNAQKLDTIDSAIAMDKFNELNSKYKKLKQELGVETLFPYNDDMDNDNVDDSSYQHLFKNSLEKFIMRNIDDFDILWRFLLSLTAKDCSIMIAMKKCSSNNIVSNGHDHHDIDNNGNNNFTSSKHQLSKPLSIDVIDKQTGGKYLAQLSIIDLDFKSACKIQRMHYNDHRMINAFIFSNFKVNSSSNIESNEWV